MFTLALMYDGFTMHYKMIMLTVTQNH